MPGIRYDTPTMFKRVLRLKRRQTIVLWTLIIIFVLPFILFFHMGVGGRSSQGPGGSAGVIFGRRIPWDVFQAQSQLIRGTLKARWGQVPESFEPWLRQQTWDRLILREEARRRTKVTDEEVAWYIQRQPMFQRNGRFDATLYYQLVQALGMNPQLFEEFLRDELRIQKLLDAVKAQVQVTDEELEAAYAKAHERLQVSLILIEPAAFAQEVTRTLIPERLREYYSTHQAAFQHPAKRTIEYLGLSAAEALTQEHAPTDEALQAFYTAHQEAFQQSDGSVPPLSDVRETAHQRYLEYRAQQRLTNLALDLEDDRDAGLRFVEIALARHLMTHRVGPLDPSAATIPNGPSREMLQAAFEESLGQMTQVFHTPEGVFLLMAVEEFPSRLPPFEEVRSAVEQQLAAEQAREAAKAKATKLHDDLVAKQQEGLSVENAWGSLGLHPLRPAPFTRGGPIESLGEVPNVTEALFALKVGEWSSVLETPKGFVIAVVEEQFPADPAQFAKERAAFRQTLLTTKQNERLSEWLASLRQQARLKSFLDQPQ